MSDNIFSFLMVSKMLHKKRSLSICFLKGEGFLFINERRGEGERR